MKKCLYLGYTNYSVMRTHKDLEVWQQSMRMVTSVYELTKEFPKEEMYGLTNQIRRAAVSVPSNIAEGAARHSRKEFIQFLYIALGSTMEVDTQIIISKNLGYLDNEKRLKLCNRINDIGKMINGLIKYLKERNS